MSNNYTLRHTVTLPDTSTVELWQQPRGKRLFKTVYGYDVKERLTYEQACTEFGACIMHALACNGAFDNQGNQNA